MGGIAGGPLSQQAGEGQVNCGLCLLAIQRSHLQLSHIYSGSVNNWQKNIPLQCGQSCLVILTIINEFQLFLLFR